MTDPLQYVPLRLIIPFDDICGLGLVCSVGYLERRSLAFSFRKLDRNAVAWRERTIESKSYEAFVSQLLFALEGAAEDGAEVDFRIGRIQHLVRTQVLDKAPEEKNAGRVAPPPHDRDAHTEQPDDRTADELPFVDAALLVGRWGSCANGDLVVFLVSPAYDEHDEED